MRAAHLREQARSTRRASRDSVITQNPRQKFNRLLRLTAALVSSPVPLVSTRYPDNDRHKSQLPVSSRAQRPTRVRELSAEQLVQHYLTQISGRDEKLHAFVAVYGEDALNAAKAADLARRAGHQLGPLHGIPIAVKDIIDMEGRVTTGGSPMWLERRSPSTAKLSNICSALA